MGPDLFLPRPDTVKQTEGDLRVGSVAFQPYYLGAYPDLVIGILCYGQLDLAPDCRQLSRQINKRALDAYIFGQHFFGNDRASFVFPFDPDRKGNGVSVALTAFLHNLSSTLAGIRRTNL